MRRGDGLGALWDAPDVVQPLLEMKDGELTVPEWGVGIQQAVAGGSRARTGRQVPPCSIGRTWPGGFRTMPRGCCLQRTIWLRERTGAKNLCMAGGVRAQLRGQRADRARGRIRQCLDPAAAGRRRRCDWPARITGPPRRSEEQALIRDEPPPCSASNNNDEEVRRSRGPKGWFAWPKRAAQPARTYARRRQIALSRALSSVGSRGVPNSDRVRWGLAASLPIRRKGCDEG